MTTKPVLDSRRIFFAALLLILFAGTALFAGAKKEEAAPSNPPVTILVAAAASLRNAYEQEIIPQFQAKYPWITVEGAFDSSGKLQTQIEQGLEADVFMSAAVTQMNNLVKNGHVDAGAVKPLLENKIVLIKTAGASTAVSGFQNITAAKMIALGDPASVPAGQYAQEIFTSLGIWDAVKAGASLGTNVTEVLNWVGAASAEVGVVYATDAASTDKVEIIAEAPAGSLARPVIYPVGQLKASAHPAEAKLFIDFLASDAGLAVFRAYGFSPNE
ncbi:MAG: molybdate ABC transporter substrate-binding protein [Spirochaetia bacterium]|jgi:molybdate transport system substrate-binding protein|nr:molybdate ABC transporter substrate-binding protein [Spirochaetia bacterium]